MLTTSSTLTVTRDDDEIKLSDNIEPHFKELWHTKRPYIVAKGGRGSFKSSTISLWLVMDMLRNIENGHVANYYIIRHTQKSLRTSVYNQITWAINTLGVTDEFHFGKTPIEIDHIATGSTFYFEGMDDPQKLKSNIVENIAGLWFEELAEFNGVEDIDQTLPTFLRQKPNWLPLQKAFFSYNPPRNPYSWVNKWLKSIADDPTYFVDHSTYLDDELQFTTEQQLNLIETYKRNDHEYYEWLYLGKVIGMGVNIYNMDLFHAVDKLPDNDPLMNIYSSQDSGQQVSATTESFYGITLSKNVYLLDTFYYSPAGKSVKKAPSEMAVDLHKFEEKIINQYDKEPWKESADSATSDFALDNERFRLYGKRYHHVAKKEKNQMIDLTQNLLATGRFHYLDTPNNKIFIEEHQNYRYDENTINTDSPKVIKENDHTCDAFQYFVLDNLRDLGVKF